MVTSYLFHLPPCVVCERAAQCPLTCSVVRFLEALGVPPPSRGWHGGFPCLQLCKKLQWDWLESFTGTPRVRAHSICVWFSPETPAMVPDTLLGTSEGICVSHLQVCPVLAQYWLILHYCDQNAHKKQRKREEGFSSGSWFQVDTWRRHCGVSSSGSLCLRLPTTWWSASGRRAQTGSSLPTWLERPLLPAKPCSWRF